jgi:hypothetical protein
MRRYMYTRLEAQKALNIVSNEHEEKFLRAGNIAEW